MDRDVLSSRKASEKDTTAVWMKGTSALQVVQTASFRQSLGNLFLQSTCDERGLRKSMQTKFPSFAHQRKFHSRKDVVTEYSTFCDVLKKLDQRVDSAGFPENSLSLRNWWISGESDVILASLEHKLILERSALEKFDVLKFTVGRFRSHRTAAVGWFCFSIPRKPVRRRSEPVVDYSESIPPRATDNRTSCSKHVRSSKVLYR